VPARQNKMPRRVAVGAVAGIHKAVAPDVVPTLGLSATFHDRSHFGSPEFRIEGLFARSEPQDVLDFGAIIGHARFLWVASRTTACPFQAKVASTTFGPCVLGRRVEAAAIARQMPFIGAPQLSAPGSKRQSAINRNKDG